MKVGVFGRNKLSEIFISEFKHRYPFPSIGKGTEIIILADKDYMAPGDLEYSYNNVNDLNFLYLPIGYKSKNLKSNKYSQAKEWGACTPSYISLGATVLDTTTTSNIKEASWIMSGSIIGIGSSVGTGSTIWSGCNLAHHCTVGEFSWLSPGVIMLGESSVGPNCFIGAGSIIGEGVSVADNCFIGAGAILTKNLSPNSVALHGKNNIVHKGDRFAVSAMYEKLK